MFKPHTTVLVTVEEAWSQTGSMAFLSSKISKDKRTFLATLLDDTHVQGVLLGSTRIDAEDDIDMSKFQLFIPWRFIRAIITHTDFGTSSPKVVGFLKKQIDNK